MARPRTFDEEDAIQQSLNVFWRYGYDATTYKLLELATKIAPRSLINVFGDKEALFLRALKKYRQMAQGIVDKVFNPPSVDAVIVFFDSVGKNPPPKGDVRHSGCLMVNTMFELGKDKPAVTAEVNAYRDMWLNTFLASLEADGIPDAETKAEFLVGGLFGALSQIRMGGHVSCAAPTAKVIADTVRSWKQ